MIGSGAGSHNGEEDGTHDAASDAAFAAADKPDFFSVPAFAPETLEPSVGSGNPTVYDGIDIE
ncbi:unnamed protein product [Parascedosporium putredinis]|uniref:Uncharacterized protein n=1 Tax=Parascedosporium putredinis TaxID=1442378 RepID=A0A9P1H7K3_9PEZI|nr:unnamed protein product [Parascedosporium putredinis]CAI7998942.1 unnamed protein product [Parascedosporium putredinis]